MCCRPAATSTRSTCRAVPTPAAWAARLAVGRAAGRAPSAGPRRLAARAGAVGLGHRQHAHRRRRHRAGAGADRRAARPGTRDSRPRHRLRDPAAGRARPAARRRDPAHLRLLPRRLPGADRAVRQRRAAPSPRSTSRRTTTRSPRACAAEARGADARRRRRRRGRAARAGYRIFGSKPGRLRRRPAGADRRARLAGRGRSRRRLPRLGRLRLWRAASTGAAARARCSRSASPTVEAVLHNQDNREHDLLDSDDYYQFEGGLAATVEHLTGRQPRRSITTTIRAPSARASARSTRRSRRVVRGRAANPKWIARRDAPRLQGRLRDRRDGRLPVRLRRHHGRGRRPPFRPGCSTPISATRRCAASSQRHNPAALAEIAERLREAQRARPLAAALQQPPTPGSTSWRRATKRATKTSA